MLWGMLGVSPGVATHGGLCEGCHQDGDAESIPFCLKGSSVPSIQGGVPRAADGGSLLGILPWETGVDAVEEAHCSHSKTPWICRLTAMVMLWGGSMVSSRKYVSAGVVVGA